jgi:hypothetical protein
MGWVIWGLNPDIGKICFSSTKHPDYLWVPQWVQGDLEPGVKQLGYEADHSLQTSAEVNHEQSHTSISIEAFMLCIVTTLRNWPAGTGNLKKSNCWSQESFKIPSVLEANVLCFTGSDSLHITRILCIAGLRPESPCHIAWQPSLRISKMLQLSCLSHMVAGTA